MKQIKLVQEDPLAGTPVLIRWYFNNYTLVYGSLSQACLSHVSHVLASKNCSMGVDGTAMCACVGGFYQCIFGQLLGVLLLVERLQSEFPPKSARFSWHAIHSLLPFGVFFLCGHNEILPRLPSQSPQKLPSNLHAA